MKIALDYDQTYTADRPLFASLVREITGKGHDVRFVTARYSNRNNNKDIEADAKALGISIIYTDGRQKEPVTFRLGWAPDIWIDDKPSAIPGSTGLSSCDLL